MFFTRLGTVVAWLALIVGALRFGSGFYVGSVNDLETRTQMAARYLGSASPGKAIDQGVIAILFAIAIGILVEISRSLRR